jgi:hypothetical protein
LAHPLTWETETGVALAGSALREAMTEGAREQEGRRNDRPGQRENGRKRDEGEYREPDQGESRNYQEDERPNKHEGGHPFESVTHCSTTFLV